MHPPLQGTDAGGEHPSIVEVDVARTAFLGEQAAVALGQTAYHVLHGAVLLAVSDQGLADPSKQPRPTAVLVVDGTARMHREPRTGRVLYLVEPLPVRNDRSADRRATQRERDRRTVGLWLRQAVDLADHDLQHPIDLRASATGHPLIFLSPSTGTRASNPTVVCPDPDPGPVDEARGHLGCPQPDGHHRRPAHLVPPPLDSGRAGHGDVLADRPGGAMAATAYPSWESSAPRSSPPCR